MKLDKICDKMTLNPAKLGENSPRNGIFEVENSENIDNFEKNASKLFVKLYFK